MVRVNKAQYFIKVVGLFKEYPKCSVVGADNVGSRQMQTIRTSLHGIGVVLMGKNTMMHKADCGHLEQKAQLGKLLPHIKGNVGFVFTKAIWLKNATNSWYQKYEPLLVLVPLLLCLSSTGLGPGKTFFFQALSIPNKISKGTIEIINHVLILKPGDKVGVSEATLLNVLNISPFSYGLNINQVYDFNSIFSSEILDFKPEGLRAKFQAGVANLAAVYLEIGYTTIAPRFTQHFQWF